MKSQAKKKTCGKPPVEDETVDSGEKAEPTKSTKGKFTIRKAPNSTKRGTSSTDDSLPAAARKPKSKALNTQERENLLSRVDSVSLLVLKEEVCTKLEKQFIPEYLKEMTTVLSEREQPLEIIIETHRYYFSRLYRECQKGSESFVRFQLSWHKHCSAFLLSSQYSLNDIDLLESNCEQLIKTRDVWLKFCEDCGIPVPESNPVMMTFCSISLQVFITVTIQLES